MLSDMDERLVGNVILWAEIKRCLDSVVMVLSTFSQPFEAVWILPPCPKRDISSQLTGKSNNRHTGTKL